MARWVQDSDRVELCEAPAEDNAFILVSLDDNNPFVRKLSSSRVVVPNFGTTLDQPFNAGHSLRLLVYPCTSSQIP